MKYNICKNTWVGKIILGFNLSHVLSMVRYQQNIKDGRRFFVNISAEIFFKNSTCGLSKISFRHVVNTKIDRRRRRGEGAVKCIKLMGCDVSVIVAGENPAAMQHGGTSAPRATFIFTVVISLSSLLR